MKRLWMAIVAIGLLVSSALAGVSVMLYADHSNVPVGQRTKIHVMAQGKGAALYQLAGDIVAPNWRFSAYPFGWASVFNCPAMPGVAGFSFRGAWVDIGSQQTALPPDPWFAYYEPVEVARYEVCGFAEGIETFIFDPHLVVGDGYSFVTQDLAGDQTIYENSTLTITCGPGAPPVAQDIGIYALPETDLSIDLQATDDGWPNPPGHLEYVITRLPEHGTLTDWVWAEQITYVPYTLHLWSNRVVYRNDPGYRRADSFEFHARDGGTTPDSGDSNTATVSLWDGDIGPGDLNGDNRVNDADAAAMAVCLTGPGVPTSDPTCADYADIDGDGDVDMSDFGILQRCSSPDHLPDPSCAG